MVELLAILHTEASTGWGGQEIRVLSEVAGLRERGHKVGILCRPESVLAARTRSAGISLLVDRMSFALDPQTIVRLLGHFRRWRPQVVVTHSSVDSWCGGVAARLLRLPVVRVRHVSVPIGGNPATRFVYRKLCNAVITTGEGIRTHLIQEVGLPPGKVVSIPTGIDTARFDPRKADGRAVRGALGIRSDEPLVGIVATLRNWKGHLVFLEAMARVREYLPGARALIVGDGPQRHNIERCLHELRLGEAVILTGHREDVPDVLASLDVVVSASTEAEGVPQVLLQALAMERPVVATAVGGIPEIIQDGETGLLVPPGDAVRLAEAIQTVLTGPAQFRPQAMIGSRRTSRRWSVAHMLDQVERVYSELAVPPW
jgi:glycosyltransferase involved in cell wall biosynthesis